MAIFEGLTYGVCFRFFGGVLEHSWSDVVKSFFASGSFIDLLAFTITFFGKLSWHFARFRNCKVNQSGFFLPVDRFGRWGLFPFMTKFGKRAVGDINFLGEIDIFLGDGENIDFLGDITVLVVQKLGNFCNFLGDSWKIRSI